MLKFLLFCGIIYSSIHLVEGRSVCDELDILLVIDSSTIVNHRNDIVGIVNSLVYDGANERSGFSVVAYGDLDQHQFRNEDDIILIDIEHTKKIHKKKKKKQFIDKYLNSALDVMSSNTKFVDIMDAVSIAVDNEQFSGDLKQIFIFQYDTSIPTESICELINLYGDNVHFINVNAFEPGTCGNEYIETYLFDDIKSHPEMLYDYSCPSTITGPDEEWIKLSKRANYMEINTIEKCELYYDSNGGGLTEMSKIYVYDNVNDDATFKVDDFIIVQEDDFDLLPMECQVGIFKINSIDQGHTEGQLILFVTSPTIFEYITASNIKSKTVNAKENKKEKDEKKRTRRRIPIVSVADTSVSANFDKEFSPSATYTGSFCIADGSVCGSVSGGSVTVNSGYTGNIGTTAKVTLDYQDACSSGTHHNIKRRLSSCGGINELSVAFDGTAKAEPYLYLTVKGTLSLSGSFWSWTKQEPITAYIYGIPVNFYPYIDISGSLSLETSSTIYLGGRIPLGGSAKFGGGWRPSGLFAERTFQTPGSTSFSMYPQGGSCSSGSNTFSVGFSVEFGVKLYKVVRGYIKPSVTLSGSVATCSDGCTGVKTSAELKLDVYVGAGFDLNDLPDWVKEYVGSFSHFGGTIDYPVCRGTQLWSKPASCSTSYCSSCSSYAKQDFPEMIEYMPHEHVNDNDEPKIRIFYGIIGMLIIINFFCTLYFCVKKISGHAKYDSYSDNSMD